MYIISYECHLKFFSMFIFKIDFKLSTEATVKCMSQYHTLSKQFTYVNDSFCNLNVFSVSEQFLALSHTYKCFLTDLAWNFSVIVFYFFIEGEAGKVREQITLVLFPGNVLSAEIKGL